MAKRPKVSEQADMISCLQDNLLCRIISFLPIKEAFRTSTLSKRFNKVFPLMSNLNFEDPFTNRRKSDSVRFMNFVDKVILLHEARVVDRFRLKCGELIKFDRVDRWIRYALKKKVKDIDLWLNCNDQSDKLYELPIGLFTRESLVSLKLDIQDKCTFVLKLPVKLFLPRLRVLHLSGNIKFSNDFKIWDGTDFWDKIKFSTDFKIWDGTDFSDNIKFSNDFIDDDDDDDSSIQRLVSSCPVLEELVLTRCVKQHKIRVCSRTLKRLTITNSWDLFDDYAVVIDAPSLVYFRCCYLTRRFLLKNLHSLVEADIELGTFFGTSESFLTHYEAAKNLFRSISTVRTLRLSGTFGKHFLEDRSIIPEFPQLTYLNLDVNFSVGWETVLPLLLAGFPCVEALVLKVQDICKVTLPSVRTPSFMLSQLKTLQILPFKFKEGELLLVEHFLKDAEALENLILKITTKSWRNPEQWRSKITKKLLNLPKVSNQCEVLVYFI